jgi:ferric-dicitrate binding protein FerR (iron transport regulator)
MRLDLNRLIANIGSPEPAPDVDALWAEAVAKMQEVVLSEPKRPARQKAGQQSTGWMRRATTPARWQFALGVILMLCVGLVAAHPSWLRHRTVDPRVAVSTYTTNNGQRANITLLDGTTIALGVASRLEVPADYARGNRTVRLVGRALFTVSHHDKSPFIVQSGAVTTRVLGTTFMVHHYANDTVTQVAVRDGKVEVNTTVLTASRMIEISQAGEIHTQRVGASPFLFAKGILALDSTRLRDAIPELDRWYDVDIRLSDPVLGQRVIEGRFPTGARSDLVEVLEWMFDARIVRDGRIITLFPKTE